MSLKKLEVHHATKRIHGNTVLQDISCTFLSGKIYGLKGINGSGKTMFMRLLCGLIRPSEGEIFYDEKKLGIDFPACPRTPKRSTGLPRRCAHRLAMTHHF